MSRADVVNALIGGDLAARGAYYEHLSFRIRLETAADLLVSSIPTWLEQARDEAARVEVARRALSDGLSIDLADLRTMRGDPVFPEQEGEHG